MYDTILKKMTYRNVGNFVFWCEERSKALSPMLTLLGLWYVGPLWVFQCFSGNTSYHHGLDFSLNLVLLPVITGNE